MQLINTDGMAFIGPGSEWFWSALTGLVLAVTFIAIYRQLRVQAHASAVEQVQWFQREGLGSELMQRLWLEVLYTLRDGTDPADLPQGAASAVGEWWESFASLVRTGHRDRRLYWQIDGRSAQFVWALLTPWVHRRRAEFGNPAIFEDLEWLAELMAEMDRLAGRPPLEALIPRIIESAIAFAEEKIRIWEAMRTVTLMQPDAVTSQQPAAAAAESAGA